MSFLFSLCYFIDSGTLIEQVLINSSAVRRGQNHFPDKPPSNDLSLICLFTGTCLLRKRDAFGFLCLLAGVVLFGGFSWAAKRQGGHKEGLDTPCLLILTESLISANWVGQFKQALQSGVSHKRDMGANRQTAVVSVLFKVGVTPHTAPVKPQCFFCQPS